MTINMDFSVPRVTTRALVDPSRKCSLRCEFCYYLPTSDLYSVQSWEQQKKQVTDAVARGCVACDISGGEPLQNPNVVELVQLCTDSGLPARIISSLICPEKILDGVLDAGVENWLISTHGAKAETHNDIVKVPKARQLQIRRLDKISERMHFCVNYVMVEKNQAEMLDWAKWMVSIKRKPLIANFINFNAFSPWLKTQEWITNAKNNVVDISIAGPILDEAIDILEDNGIGVNVRYYPFCGLSERHYKNVCNDLVVWADQGEWDNGIGSHNLEDGIRYGKRLTDSNEEKNAPCSTCSHQWICGGANKIWHKLAAEKFGREVLHPLPVLPEGCKSDDFWYYRCKNTLGLDPRVQGFRKLEPSS